ncbi:MAG TPA: glutaredoxin 2 [Bacteriovoracaceae bacterium]|nr:glutaredoxin 2 [Bacteriovoracaceae bacterium]
MKLTLYHYVHCPFCIRVRMALGLLNLPFESVVLPYDDEATPLKLTGKKMLPILTAEGAPMNESLEIMAFLDQQNTLGMKAMVSSLQFAVFTQKLTDLGETVHSLAMPYWVYTQEFDERSRNYFKHKKELKRGPFGALMRNRDVFVSELSGKISYLETRLVPFYDSEKVSGYDVLLAAHLWGLYAVPEFHFSERVHAYLQTVKQLCNFNYHQDYWS